MPRGEIAGTAPPDGRPRFSAEQLARWRETLHVSCLQRHRHLTGWAEIMHGLLSADASVSLMLLSFLGILDASGVALSHADKLQLAQVVAAAAETGGGHALRGVTNQFSGTPTASALTAIGIHIEPRGHVRAPPREPPTAV